MKSIILPSAYKNSIINIISASYEIMITLNTPVIETMHDETNEGYRADGQVSDNENVRIEYSGQNDCNESIRENEVEFHEFGEWRILFNRFILWLSFRAHEFHVIIIRCTDSMIIVLVHGFNDTFPVSCPGKTGTYKCVRVMSC